uniref:Lipopolysaccharide-induced tumor necrosis factor-alpha factor n=1 Tax=Melanaphis sacchari TaxID=742174 RepID=A0A2H8TKI0_9HEMI
MDFSFAPAAILHWKKMKKKKKKKMLENLSKRALSSTGAPIVVTLQPMGPESTYTYCYSCNNKIHTTTSINYKSIAWLSSLLMCVVGCFFGCCLIPFCIDSCSNIKHKCPECDAFLGLYKP